MSVKLQGSVFIPATSGCFSGLKGLGSFLMGRSIWIMLGKVTPGSTRHEVLAISGPFTLFLHHQPVESHEEGVQHTASVSSMTVV